jgi:hypothetical protein
MFNFAALFSLVAISGVMAAPHFKVCAFCLHSIYPITYQNLVEHQMCRSEIHHFLPSRIQQAPECHHYTVDLKEMDYVVHNLGYAPEQVDAHIVPQKTPFAKKSSATSGQTLATTCTQSTTKMRNAVVGKKSPGLRATSTKTTITPALCRFSALQRRQRRPFLHD